MRAEAGVIKKREVCHVYSSLITAIIGIDSGYIDPCYAQNAPLHYCRISYCLRRYRFSALVLLTQRAKAAS